MSLVSLYSTHIHNVCMVLSTAYMFVTIQTCRPVVQLCQGLPEGRHRDSSHLIITSPSFLLWNSSTSSSGPTHSTQSFQCFTHQIQHFFFFSKQDKLVIVMTNKTHPPPAVLLFVLCLSMNYTYHSCSTFMWKLCSNCRNSWQTFSNSFFKQSALIRHSGDYKYSSY